VGLLSWISKSQRKRPVVYRSTLTPFEKGENDGIKGRANRYAKRAYLERVAWECASKTERAQQLRGGYTESAHGLLLDPYGNSKMIERQLAAPGTPEEYKLGYRMGTKLRRRGG
jgi:hypothetical protein